MDATIPQITPSAADGAATQTAAETASETTTAQPEIALTDTQKDIQKIEEALANLRKYGGILVVDEIQSLENKLKDLQKKAEKEVEAAKTAVSETINEAVTEVKTLADQFYAKTGIRPWGIVIATALYVAAKIAGVLFPWLR